MVLLILSESVGLGDVPTRLVLIFGISNEIEIVLMITTFLCLGFVI